MALTYFALPANVEHIATVASLDKEPVETSLRTLSNRSLVVPDQEERAFSVVPMVVDFLRRERPKVVAETGDRLEQRAFAMIVENGYQEHGRFPVLDEAWPTVAPALSLFVAGSNERLQTMCDALRLFLEFTGRWDEWLSLEQKAEARAVAVSDYNSAGRRAFQAGWVLHLRQQGEVVLACANRAAEHWQTAKAGSLERSAAARLMGIGHQMKGEYPAAVVKFREALELRRSLSAESEDIAKILNDLASIEHFSDDYEAAERDYRIALRVASSVGYAEGVAYITGNLAELALDQGDWIKAETLAREALAFSESVGRQQLIASNCYRLSRTLVLQDKKDEALAFALRAVEIFTRLGLALNLEFAHKILKVCEA